ncbi:MAG: hypothetical protein PHI27_13765 [Eubacteriales bacterium]|nr:hypothetical protein [Eubacteriales bacterium]
MTYEVYLNITRPFDTRNATEKRIFTNQFYRKYGNGTPLSERGLPDWTDSTDLIEFIQENGLDYDGIILDEGGTGGYGEEVKLRGLSYVPLEPEQIKSADPVTYDDAGNPIPLSQRFDTGQTDIRYSQRDPENSLPSARAILGGAFGEVAQTDAEKKRVAEYRKSADRYNRLENELNNLLDRRKQLYRDKAPQSEKNELRADINALRDKLDKADRVLLNLQMSKPLRDVVKRETDRAYGAYQEKAAERVAQARQGMRDTGVRGKIRNVYLRMMKALANPTEKQYVPAQYVRPLIDIAEAIDVTGKSVKLSEKIAKFKERYEALKTDTDYSLSSEFDESILNEIKALQKEIGETLPINLKGEQLERLYKVLRAVETTLMNARKLIASNIAKTNYEAADQIIGEVRASKGIGFSRVSNFLLRYTTGMLDARRAARLLAGYAENGMLERLITHLNEGQLKKNDFIMQGSRLFDFLTDGKENAAQLRKFTGRGAEWISTGIKDAQGHELKITPAMRASLYMHTLNNDNLKHLFGGGITMPAIDLYKQGRFAEAFKRGNTFHLTEDQVKKILAGMTAYEKAWVKAAQEFFAYSTEKINETSMQLVGYKKAMVQNYFPIQSDRNFLRVDFESIARDGSIEGMGFLKERVGSTNPMYLMDITSVLDRQLNNTAKYVGLAIPVRNFNKVYRVSTKGYADSVQAALNQMWGDKATKYLENLMADIQDARKNPPTFFDKAKGRFAQSVLALNPSVSLKQAASYPTAAAVLGWKPLMKALGRGGKKGTPLSRADQDLIAKYTPLLWLRTKGMSTTELGDIRAMKPEFGAVSKLSEAAHKYLLNWIQQIDTATVGRLWYAAQYNIDAARPDLEKGSDAYYQEVAKLFNRAVEETQPDYTVMQRPDILRNPNAVIRGMTMFMTQRLQNFGILYDAAGELMETGRKLKADPKNEALKSQRERAGKQLNRAIFSQAVSALVLSLMTLLGKAVLHRPDEYRDEDNQLVPGSIVEQVARDVPSILLGMVVGGAEMYETALSLLTGKRSYGLQFSPIEFINDLKTSFDNLLMEVNKTVAEGKDPRKLIDSASKVAMQALTFLGMPVNNAKKIVDGVYLHYKDFEDGAFGSFKAGRADIDKRTAYANFVEAFTAGDQVRMDLLMKELQDAEVTESGIKSGIRAAIKANFEAGKTNRETYIQQMIDATDYDDVKNDIIKQWFAAGEIDEAEAKRLLLKFTDDDEPTEQFRTLEIWKHVPENDEDSYRVLNKFLEAVRTGKNLRAVVTEYTNPNKYAYDSKYLAGQITTAFKQEYIDNPAQRSRLKGYLLNAYTLLGYDRDKKSGDIDRWLVKYDSDDFENAIATGVNLKAVIDEKIKYSTAKNPKGVIISQVTATFADQYKKMTPTERAKIKPRLIDAYVMLGYDRAYSSKKIDKWLTD